MPLPRGTTRGASIALPVRVNHVEKGFALAEALIASALLASSLVMVAQLFGIAAQSTAGAKDTTFATVLAAQKMEQLRSLTWRFYRGAAVSDMTSDTAATLETSAGGTGLATSPVGSLFTNTNGYVDYADPNGVSLGGGPSPPTNTAFIRRWSVEPLSSNPDTLVIQVRVLDVRTGTRTSAALAPRQPGEVRLVTVRARKAS